MTTLTPTRAAMQTLRAIADTIRECSPVPSGTIYAGLMTQGCTLEQWQRILRGMESAGLVRVDPSHLIHWTGPKQENQR